MKKRTISIINNLLEKQVKLENQMENLEEKLTERKERG
jgi:hypothetical protein